MFVIRETFTAKPGQASTLARQLKTATALSPAVKTRVLTDYIARFNTVVIETEVEDLAVFDRQMTEYMSNPDVRTAMEGYADRYLTGTREVYRVV